MAREARSTPSADGISISAHHRGRNRRIHAAHRGTRRHILRRLRRHSHLQYSFWRGAPLELALRGQAIRQQTADERIAIETTHSNRPSDGSTWDLDGNLS